MRNPWLRPAPDYYPDNVKLVQPVSVEDRKTELRLFDIRKLRRIIIWPGTQKTVLSLAKRELKQRLRDADPKRK